MKKANKKVKEKRIVSLLLTMMMLVSFIVPKMNTIVYAQENEPVTKETDEDVIICAGDIHTYEDDGYSVKYIIENVWDGNYTAKIEITNKTTEPIDNWMISFACRDEISNIYNAQIVKHEDTLYQIKNVEYNQDIPALGSVSFGYQVTYSKSADIPEPYVVLSEDTAVENNGYQTELHIVNAWDGGYIGELIITNTGADTIEDWYLICETDDEIINIWNATLDANEEGYEVIYSADYQQNIHVGESYVIGFQADGNSQNVIIHNLYELKYAENADDSDTDKDKDDASDPDNKESEDKDMNEDITEYDVIVNTEAFRAADIDNTYYVETVVNELDGELVGYENVAQMEYVLSDINGYILAQGTVFNAQEGDEAQKQWNIEDFGLVIGCNVLTFQLTLKDGVIIEDEIVFIDLYGENMERVDVDLSDSDEDGLNNYFETVLKTDAQLADTDGDNLSDFDEFILIGTDPLLKDTDGNGTEDSQEDYDGDGLNAIREMAYGTNPILADSDYDGVDDGSEINRFLSNPMVEDTDGDSLLDGEEVAMGLSPTLTDTDGDGILDCDEIVQQTASIEFSDEEVVISGIDVSLECAGSIDNEVFIEDMAGRNSLSNGVVGLVGSPINIHTDVVFDEAEIVFHYNPEELSNIEEENLGVLWYDEANNQFVIMDNVYVDTEEHCVTCITTHFSEYMLVDKEQWYSVWMQASSYEPVYTPLDIAIISDETAPTFHYWGRGYGYINFPNGYIDGENIIYAYFNAEGVHTHSSSWVSDEGRYLKASESIFYYHFVLASTAPRNGDGKYGDAFVRMVEMFSDSYYEILHSDNPKVVLFTYGGTLQETEEQNQKVEESVEKLQRMGVTVYAVSETSQTNTLIENAAIATGGEHFNALTMEEPQQLWLTIHEKMSDLDKDTDGDGLPDVYEINGMRVPSGNVIITDPNDPDTDGDGRTDGEEMGELVDIVVEVDGEGTKKTFQVYKWVSDPNDDSDWGMLSGDFIFVDSLDYMPECGIFNNLIYTKEVTSLVSWTNKRPVDKYGEKIYGLMNLHNSLDFSTNGYKSNVYDDVETIYRIYDKWILFVSLIQTGSTVLFEEGEYQAAEFLNHFLMNNGVTYEYDATSIYTHNIRKMLHTNLYYLKEECIDVLNEGETRYIATSYNANFPASNILDKDNSIKQFLSAVLNINSFLAVNDCHAVFVAQCSYDGEKYTVIYEYYILDFYDWDSKVIEELYALNVYGVSQSFVSVGKITGVATFEKDSKIYNSDYMF